MHSVARNKENICAQFGLPEHLFDVRADLKHLLVRLRLYLGQLLFGVGTLPKKNAR